jgi:RNA polymerase sigma factor (sigma-70 family)
VSIALAQAPPADATRLLYERHSSRIFGFCLSRLGSREEAEDAVQTTFMNAQRGLGRGVVPEYELAWLFKIAQNVCHNRHQSARRRGRVEAAQDLDSLQDVIASPERSAAVSLGELTQALGAIPERQRHALLLREFQGLTYEEIADELGISVAAVETLLFRARRGVGQQLEQAGARPTRRRGAIASVFELFRWLFSGGAAPLKVAAVTAAVATTATLAVTPVARDGAATRATPKLSTPRAAVDAMRHAPARPAVRTVGPKGSSPVVAQQTTDPVEHPVVASTPPPMETAPKPTASTPSPTLTKPQTLPLPQATTPTLPLPDVTVPPLNAPELPLPDVKLPDVKLPDAQLPSVQLP